MAVNGKDICPLRMLPAEVLHSAVIVDDIPPESLRPEVCAPNMVSRGHIAPHKAMSAQSGIYLFPGLAGSLADCPDGAIADTGLGWVGVVELEAVTFHSHTPAFLRCTHQTDSQRISESVSAFQKSVS